MNDSPAPSAPLDDAERIALVDVLRGFALLGILAVNMSLFSASWIGFAIGLPRGSSPADALAEFVITALGTSKFYPLFSLLFGFGMSIQLERAQRRGASFARLFVRRMLVLLAFGLGHALLLWNGDILVTYALIGLVLILFRNVPPRTLLVWAAVLFAIPFVLGLSNGVLGVIAGRSFMAGQGGFDVNAMLADLARRAEDVYARGTWPQIFIWRAVEWVVLSAATAFATAPQVLGLFLLGVYAGKAGLFRDIGAHAPLFRAGLRFGLGVGLPANALIAVGQAAGRGDVFSPFTGLAQPFLLVVGPLLAAGYVSAFALFGRDPDRLRRLAPLAAAGRMALSNYLMQSLICTTIFYSYGLGLFGRVGALAGLGLTLAIWLAQLAVSTLWMRAFRYGPAEWLWRALAYGRRPPMRRAHASPSPEADAPPRR